MALMTLDSLDIKEAALTGIQMDLVRGYFEPPSVRGADLVIPGADYRVVRDRRKDARILLLEGYVTGTSASDWRTNVEALMAKCTGLAAINLVIADGYLGTTGTHTIAVRCLPPPVGGPPLYAVKYQTWSIEFLALADWS
jgi:hypothetical protein